MSLLIFGVSNPTALTPEIKKLINEYSEFG